MNKVNKVLITLMFAAMFLPLQFVQAEPLADANGSPESEPYVEAEPFVDADDSNSTDSAVPAQAEPSLSMDDFRRPVRGPLWMDDAARSERYPTDEWYIGFSRDILEDRTLLAISLESIERDALGRMIGSIVASVSDVSITAISSDMRRGGRGGDSEVITRDYRRRLEVVARAEVTNPFIESWFDPEKNEIYAFAAVRKSDLARYYADMIESSISAAERDMERAAEQGRAGERRRALETIAQVHTRLESLAHQMMLLIAVDAASGLERSQGERVSELQRMGDALRFEFEREMRVHDKKIRIGPRLALHNSSVSGLIFSVDDFDGYRFTTERYENKALTLTPWGVEFGAMANIDLSHHLFLNTGLNIVYRSPVSTEVNRINEFTLSIPILARYRIKDVYIESGAAFEIPFNTKISWEGIDPISYEQRKAVNIGVVIGAGYYLHRNITLDARFGIGLNSFEEEPGHTLYTLGFGVSYLR
ncbi:MAG: PorT family protein [Chitinispirillales bacterium]|jgi:hypothetical protein|nr:PorT family protein [Chitinispirillales bacterium]